jgi:hypothetical protein
VRVACDIRGQFSIMADWDIEFALVPAPPHATVYGSVGQRSAAQHIALCKLMRAEKRGKPTADTAEDSRHH